MYVIFNLKQNKAFKEKVDKRLYYPFDSKTPNVLVKL